MNGQAGSRGYLVQSVIALLQSLDDNGWTTVTIESHAESEKVDICWELPGRKRVAQVKSSENQIGIADARKWARDLERSATADDLELILVGPCAQSVVEIGKIGTVSVPCPKSLDPQRLLGQAAHLLDKLLLAEGLSRQSPYQREVMVHALTTELLLHSAEATSLTRREFVDTLKCWISSITHPIGSAWERVDFREQRTIESAVAGKGLGPADVQACPPFSVTHEIINELRRSHLYEIVGTSGCGKSISAWHVAKTFFDEGYSIWRPHPMSKAEDLLELPGGKLRVLVIDDAQQFGPSFAQRLSETSSAETKVLLISTVDNPLLANVICIPAARCVDELKVALLARRTEILPIVRSYDDTIGDRYFETSLQSRLFECGRQRSAWEFFWVLRGGWTTARREFESLKQFPNADYVIAAVAIGQILTCDGGVTYEWLVSFAKSDRLGENDVKKALHYLDGLGLILSSDVIRTIHLSYAYKLLDECLRLHNQYVWPAVMSLCRTAFSEGRPSLKGICWLLGAIAYTDAFRSTGSEELVSLRAPLINRCTLQPDDPDWAVGCMARLIAAFNFSCDSILAHKPLLLDWLTSRRHLVALFSSDIVNSLINLSRREEGPDRTEAVKALIDEVDVGRLAESFSNVQLEDFYSFGALLSRLSFFGPRWASEFQQRFDWARVKQLVLRADADRAYAVSKFVGSLSLLAGRRSTDEGLTYIYDVVPFLTRAINERPLETISDMHDIFWSCLGLAPKFLRSGPPDISQLNVARAIVEKLDPTRFASALATPVSRDLETMARSLEPICKVDREFPFRVTQSLRESGFLASTVEDWKTQSSELDSFIRFFCHGPDFENRRVSGCGRSETL